MTIPTAQLEMHMLLLPCHCTYMLHHSLFTSSNKFVLASAVSPCFQDTALPVLTPLLPSLLPCRGELSRGKEAALARALEVVEAQLSPTSPAGLQRRLDALAAACRLRVSSGVGLAGQGDGGRLDESSLAQLFNVLKEHMEGLKQLQEVLRR